MIPGAAGAGTTRARRQAGMAGVALLAPTASHSMGSGRHQVASALPLAFCGYLREGVRLSVPPSAPLPSSIPQDTKRGGSKGQPVVHTPARDIWMPLVSAMTDGKQESLQTKRHRHAGAGFPYRRHRLALWPAQGNQGMILITPAASEERAWVWAEKTRKLRVAGAWLSHVTHV